MNKYTYSFFQLYAELCAQACELAFRDASGAAFRHLGFDSVKFVEDKDLDAQAYVVANDQLCLVVYRATESAQDWAVNKDYEMIDRGFMRMHGGFYKATSSLEAQIYEEVNKISSTSDVDRPKDQALVFAGHSLGGAMATIAAYDYRHWKPDCTITFGAPRVFHKDTAGRLDSDNSFRLLRVAYAADGITRVPFMGQGFRHCGIPVYFRTNGKFDIAGPTFWTDLGEFAKDSVSEVLRRELFEWEDHEMRRYKELIKPVIQTLTPVYI